MAVSFPNNQNRNGSIVNNGAYYDYVPCRKHGRPDHFAIIDAVNTGTITLLNGILTITGCTDQNAGGLKIPVAQLRGLAYQVAGTAAVAGVRRLRCFTGPCAAFTGMSLAVTRELTDCNVEEKKWFYYKSYESCSETAFTCAQKLTDFAAYINADPTAPFVALYVDSGTDYIQLTDKVAGDSLRIDSYDGLENLTVDTVPVTGGYSVKDLKDSWGVTCITAADDVLYDITLFQYMAEIPMNRDMYGGSNPAQNDYSYIGKLKTVALAVSSAGGAQAQEAELIEILGGEKDYGYYISHVLGLPAPPPPTPTPAP